MPNEPIAIIKFDIKTKCKKCGAKLPARATGSLCRKCSCPSNANQVKKSKLSDKKCKNCGTLLGKNNKTGYCTNCAASAFDAFRKGRKCKVCGGPVSDTSRTGACKKCYYKTKHWKKIKRQRGSEMTAILHKDKNIFYGEE